MKDAKSKLPSEAIEPFSQKPPIVGRARTRLP
jgi:hypothetical protein